jgi:hypothetical protein
MSTFADRILAAINVPNRWGAPGAVKRGRSAALPYVPVVVYSDHTSNPAHRRAFATREEAVAFAAACIEQAKAVTAKNLTLPGFRGLREQYGLPRELPTAGEG